MSERACVYCAAPVGTRRGQVFVCVFCKPLHTKLKNDAARTLVKAMRRGEIGPANEHLCVDCGKRAYGWDHRDYSRPLDVVPVCMSCNVKRGAAVPSFVVGVSHREAA